MSSITTSALDTPAGRSIEQTCDDLALAVLAVVSVVAGLTFKDYGLGWGRLHSRGICRSASEKCSAAASRTPALCPSPIFTCTAAASTWQPRCCTRSFRSNYLRRGGCWAPSSASSASVVTWRLARRVGGPVAGLAAIALLALCPTFYGHMFMNPKDAPFAVSMAILMLGLVRPRAGISGAHAAHDPDYRSRRWPVDRLPYPGWTGADLCRDRIPANLDFGRPHAWRA